jgi:cytidine deaminase
MKTEEVRKLDSFLQSLIVEAMETSKKSIAEYYKYMVCTIIVDKDGNIYRGVNWEPANGNTVCAEIGAISSYVLSERNGIKYVITYGCRMEHEKREDMFCMPCGSCRQRLNEFCDENTKFYGINEAGNKVRITDLQELLPYSFNRNNLMN